MKRFRSGLVVGKFCPLHLGHERVIRRALDECEHVIVLSYTKPEFQNCGPSQRAEWLALRFPTTQRLVFDDAILERLCDTRGLAARPVPANDAADDVHREFVAWLCMDVIGSIVEAVFTSEDYGAGLAEVLTNRFRTRRTDAHVDHIAVDPQRSAVPVSGTLVRSDPHQHREFLAPEVYASFVTRVCVLGGESSGKTTFAKRLAEKLRTVWVPEYGRELWERRNGQLDFEDMLHIGQTQVQWEHEHLRQAHRWLLCDTSPLTTLFYSHALFQSADSALIALADRAYGHTFLCEADFDFVQDGTRKDDRFRRLQHDWYVSELNQRGWNFTPLSGPVESRVELAEQILSQAW